MTSKKPYRRILISPLNWGFGHATRLIQVVDALLKEGHYVLLGGEAPSIDILRQTFPALEWIELPGFNVQLSKGTQQWFKLLQQMPSFIHSIRNEHKATQAIIKKYHIDLIISDNRYGVYSRSIPSVIITHQTTPYLGRHFVFLRPLSNLLSKLWLKRFDECWIPDIKADVNLSGHLSQVVKGLSTQYLGWLSRLALVNAGDYHEEVDILVVLSGPVQPRSQLEQLLISQLKNSSLKTVIISGCLHKMPYSAGNIRILPHCSAELQKHLIMQSKYIVCRSGYSTLMDLVHCHRTALLIPTPGQFEQEYLAERASKHWGFSYTPQQKLQQVSIEELLSLQKITKKSFTVHNFELPLLPSGCS